MTNSFVIAALSAALAQSPNAKPQQLDVITDPEAYAVYAAVLPGEWGNVSKGALLLQQETETSSMCSFPVQDVMWEDVEKSFKAENARAQLLRPTLRLEIPYRLVARAEIAADDARLAIKYPGTWQRRPESIEYAAVSAVGFNSTKTKAIVYVRLRSSGNIYFMEKRAGKWINAPHGGCGWIA